MCGHPGGWLGQQLERPMTQPAAAPGDPMRASVDQQGISLAVMDLIGRGQLLDGCSTAIGDVNVQHDVGRHRLVAPQAENRREVMFEIRPGQ